MNRQEFEREATLRMLPSCASVFEDPELAADFIGQTVSLVAEMLFSTQSQTIFADGGELSEVSNGDRSGISVEELHSRGEIDMRVYKIMRCVLRVEYLAEIAGQRKATVWSYRGVGRKMISQLNTLLDKYGYKTLI